jgi:hypothetical protein
MKPTVGRITHYVDHPHDHFAAIIIAVSHFDDEGVTLTVFDPNESVPLRQRYVTHDEDKSSGTWHWPEREQ